MKINLLGRFFLVLIAFVDQYVWAGGEEQKSPPVIKRFGEYEVTIERKDDFYEHVTILKGKRKVYEDKNDRFFFGNFSAHFPDRTDSYSGKDLNGNNIPDLVITKYTGGMHCCHFLNIFELGKNFRKITTIEGGSYGFEFVDLDNDKFPEIVFWDGPIDYVFSSFAHSAQGRTVLKFTNNHYEIASSLMRKKTPTAKERKRIEDEIVEAFKNNDLPHPPYIFLKQMMDLSYTGHLKLALEIARKTWPAKFPGLLTFEKDFPKHLNNSRYWKEFSRRK